MQTVHMAKTLPGGAGSRRRDRLGIAVVAALVDDVVSGRYVADSALPPEGELADRFRVSRTVVRESVKLLQEKGLVVIRQGIGTVVRPAQGWNMIDDDVLTALIRADDSLTVLDELVAVRATLERDLAEAAAAAQARRSGSTTELRAALAAMEMAADDLPAFSAADVAFHDAVMDLSGKRLARAIVASIHGKARTTDRYVGATSARYTALTLQEHRDIVAAVESGDGGRAATAMYNHIVDSWSRRRPMR